MLRVAGITYKSNFNNPAAANGWIGRAERLLADVEPGPLHGWTSIARAYRMDDLDIAEGLTRSAHELARLAADADLEIVALAQLGLINVSRGEVDAGFSLLDEAMAAALAGESTSLDTVVYTCCDMLNACELVSDLARAAQWCQVAEGFVEAYGCPFLYAECRIYYGSVLAATGRWSDAELQLGDGVRMTEQCIPALHDRAIARLADLRVQQGRLEDAEQLLARIIERADLEIESTMAVAALLLACGDAAAASQRIEQRLRRATPRRADALSVLIEARLASGEIDRARSAVRRAQRDRHHEPRAAAWRLCTCGRWADSPTRQATTTRQRRTCGPRSTCGPQLDLPFETARTRFDLARALAASEPDLAVDQLRAALAAFEAIGASLDADRVAECMRSLGVRSRTGARGSGLLTGREQQVLRLLAAGLSNSEIGERLHVSRRTASHHVSHILTKLDLRNRAEAAANASKWVN